VLARVRALAGRPWMLFTIAALCWLAYDAGIAQRLSATKAAAWTVGIAR
jgi:hypothetical protein